MSPPYPALLFTGQRIIDEAHQVTGKVVERVSLATLASPTAKPVDQYRGTADASRQGEHTRIHLSGLRESQHDWNDARRHRSCPDEEHMQQLQDDHDNKRTHPE